MSATATTVTVDRQVLYDLLVEVDAFVNIFSWIAGCYPAAISEGLSNTAARVQREALGEAAYDEDTREFTGVHGELDRAGKRRGHALLFEISGGGAS